MKIDDIKSNALTGKTILITGAGDGIGKQAALTLSEYGATCILLGRTVSKLEAVYDEIMQRGLNEPSIVPLDMQGATSKHYEDMANTIEHEYGSLEGALHNASVLGQMGRFVDIKPEEWQQIMQINLTSAVMMTQKLIPVLQKAKQSSVVFTSSGVGKVGKAFWGTYAVSKFATEGLMQTVADEYKDSSIRFNCINPGATRTDMRAKAYPAENAERLMTPLDIMPTYLYLFSDASNKINGQSLNCQS